LNGQKESYLSAIPWFFRIPIIITRHVPLKNVHGIRRLLAVANFRMASRIVCVSSLLYRQLASVVSPAKLIILPNWMENLPQPRDVLSSNHGSSFRVLYVGRIEATKGIFNLIDAIKHVDTVSLDVVGAGSAMQAARAAAKGLPIVFHGFQSDCGPFYCAADLLVFPSHPDLEGQGQVPFEAMAHGLPCLISNIEVALETADGGACAEVFRWGDSADLYRAITHLRDHPERLRELSAAGLMRVRSAYTLENVRPGYFRLFDELTETCRTEQPGLR
jgi:glycosyltransferase involved in cell wall biosynthesis